jgi:hypothetical protein
VSTQDVDDPGAARPNMMSRHEFLKRILQSGQITKVAQHLALAIVILADKSRLDATVRDLEEMTGWSKTTIADHLPKLASIIAVTVGTGREKSTFEVQGLIEDALNEAVVLGSRAPAVSASRTQVVSGSRTQDRSVRQPDTKTRSVREADTSADRSVREVDTKPVVSASRTQNLPAYKESRAPARIESKTNREREEKEERARASVAEATKSTTPHMNGVGFVIDAARGAIITAVTVASWRDRFPHIPDLEAAMQRLSVNMLSSVSHPGWSCPEAWMAGPLASMNEEAKQKRQAADARIAAAKPKQPERVANR